MIRTWGLSKAYRGHPVLTDLDLEVPPGVVFGYLGPNGAGKSTTTRLLAGLLRPTTGRATVCGLDTVRQRQAVRRRIGYLPDNFAGYPDLTGEQYLRHLGNLRAGVDLGSAPDLAKRLDVDLGRRIAAMSYGDRRKVGIVQAFQHQPEVLILDEPSSGLDPPAHREFHALVREARDAGRTVLLCSPLLSEVEAVADLVGMLRRGRLREVLSVAQLRARALRWIDLVFDGPSPVAQLRRAAGVRQIRLDGRCVRVAVVGSAAELFAIAAPYRIESVTSHEPDLDETFLSHDGRT